MGKYTKYVNVFQGNSTVSADWNEGIAKTWNPIKGLSGNTHPGAQLPFGKISVGAYSGGYPTGYGNNKLNCGEPVEALYDIKSVFGISHLHHSGTGAVGFYYNYALTTPFFGDLRAPDRDVLVNEVAHPGFYAASFMKKNINFELTVDRNSAYHKYTFNQEDGKISVDLSNDGLYNDNRLRSDAGDAQIKILSDSLVCATVELQGIKLNFTIHCDTGKAVIWENYTVVDRHELNTNGSKGNKFGIVFENVGLKANVTVTVSIASPERSLDDNARSRVLGFDLAKHEADKEWEDALSKFVIDADSKSKEVFYSYLYHTLVKPSDWSGESLYYTDDSFMLDFTTLWDVYKTQLPLVFSVYPEISSKIINTYYNLGQALGVMPNLFDLSSNFNGEAQQARFLAGYIFCDAYYRGVKGVDWADLLKLLCDILHKSDKDFFEAGECSRTTHTLDMAEACSNLSRLADILSLDDMSKELKAHSSKWKNAFDAETGLLKADSEYYEGNLWNYSFRPMNSMNERIELAGGKKAFCGLLDRFFGYDHKDDFSARFEGFNNETDMESPYAYNYIGRMDRLAEIISCANDFLFTAGEGGAPGNVDSGGLSACYIWNALGVFPVSGQDLMLVGMPSFNKASVTLANGKVFTVVKHGCGSYVKQGKLNGRQLPDFKFTVSDMMNGGVLELYTE